MNHVPFCEVGHRKGLNLPVLAIDFAFSNRTTKNSLLVMISCDIFNGFELNDSIILCMIRSCPSAGFYCGLAAIYLIAL